MLRVTVDPSFLILNRAKPLITKPNSGYFSKVTTKCFLIISTDKKVIDFGPHPMRFGILLDMRTLGHRIMILCEFAGICAWI